MGQQQRVTAALAILKFCLHCFKFFFSYLKRPGSWSITQSEYVPLTSGLYMHRMLQQI